MPARAMIKDDPFAFNSVSIYLGRTMPEYEKLTIIEPMQVVESDHVQNTAVDEPSLRLPEDLARALLDALAAHFGGTSEAQTLRSDYLAERKRVDKMIDLLGGAK